MLDPQPVMLIESSDDAEIHRAIVDTIENQIRDQQPAETALTLARLMAAGESREVALRYIGCVLSVEFFEILENDAVFDEARYVRNLKALPLLPYDTSEI